MELLWRVMLLANVGYLSSATLCYIGYSERRNPKRMEMSGCSACRIVIRYELPPTAFPYPVSTSRESEPPTIPEDQQPSDISYTCFTTATLDRCERTCRYLRATVGPNEMIGECRCCITDLCNGAASKQTFNSLLLLSFMFTVSSYFIQ